MTRCPDCGGELESIVRTTAEGEFRERELDDGGLESYVALDEDSTKTQLFVRCRVCEYEAEDDGEA